MYVKYCENKPKSEYIVAEYIDFFEVTSHHISETARPNFATFSVRVAVAVARSVFLCTSGFVDDVVLAHVDRAVVKASGKCILKVTCQEPHRTESDSEIALFSDQGRI